MTARGCVSNGCTMNLRTVTYRFQAPMEHIAGVEVVEAFGNIR